MDEPTCKRCGVDVEHGSTECEVCHDLWYMDDAELLEWARRFVAFQESK